MNKTKYKKIGYVLCAALLGMVTGCVHTPQHQAVYGPPPPDYVEDGVVLQDYYYYYPGYQVYYSSSRREYVYLEGSTWVTRPAPPRVSAEVLFASPTVRLDFHDSPEIHHARVVRQYPHNWLPPGSSFYPGRANRDAERRNVRDRR